MNVGNNPPERRKKYKDAPPLQTINRIRKILEECSVFTIESHQNIYTKRQFDSCRVVLDNNGLGYCDIGTNGKGMTREYSLASGYAEFMERLQNNMLLSKSIYLLSNVFNSGNTNINMDRLSGFFTGFTYAPDEKYVKYSESKKYNYEFFNALFRNPALNALKNHLETTNPDLLSVPFYEPSNDTVRYLPYLLINQLTGSNGLCAGNTPEEAMVQGICEIFERYAMFEIFTTEIVPPTVPMEFFKGTLIYDKIVLLAEEGISVKIKDCSLGRKLPVFAVILQKENTNEYLAHIGSDPYPVTALERCLTEIYQGRNEPCFFKLHENELIAASKKNLKFTVDNPFYRNLYRNVIDGTGHYPLNMFSEESSYEFTGFQFDWGRSSSEDLINLTKLISDMNMKLYVRDMSSLGFPSYHLFIPGMSNIFYIDALPDISSEVKIFLTLSNLKKSSPDKLLELIKIIESTTISKNNKTLGRFITNYNSVYLEDGLKDTPGELLMLMLYYKVRNYRKAYEYSCRFLESESSREIECHDRLYYCCVRDFLKALSEGKSIKELSDQLSIMYGKELSEEVVESLDDPDCVFDSYSLPSCFDCDSCEVKDGCRMFDMLAIFKKIQEKQSANKIDQMALTKYFKTS